MDPQIPFFQIPELLRLSIIKKMSADKFVKFHRTNRFVHSECHARNYNIMLELESIEVKEVNRKPQFTLKQKAAGAKVDYEEVEDASTIFRFSTEIITLRTLKSAMISAVIDLAEKHKVQTRTMSLSRGFDPDNRVFECCEIVRPRSFQVILPAMMKDVHPVERFGRHSWNIWCGSTDYDDDDLLRLPANNIKVINWMTNITTNGIRQYVEEWLLGERKIKHFNGRMKNWLDISFLEEALPMNLLYSSSEHKHSILSRLRPGDTIMEDHPTPLASVKVYILWRPDDIFQKLLVILCDRQDLSYPHIQMSTEVDPIGFFLKKCLCDVQRLYLDL